MQKGGDEASTCGRVIQGLNQYDKNHTRFVMIELLFFLDLSQKQISVPNPKCITLDNPYRMWGSRMSHARR